MDEITTLRLTLSGCTKAANSVRWRTAVQRRSARLGGLCRRLMAALGPRFVRRERAGDAILFFAKASDDSVVEAARITNVSGQHSVEELEAELVLSILEPRMFACRKPRMEDD